MQSPLVTIVCLCYNHANFISKALQSIWDLNYPNIQLIIADDASTDNSQQIIKKLVKERNVELLFNTVNIGHCKTFNKALKLAKGAFIIDLAADDMLLPESVSVGVSELQKRGDEYGVFFADATLVDFSGTIIGNHITQSFFKNRIVPQGEVYKSILSKYFINPVTMIYRKSMVDQLGGYDEYLNYEDFDFWVRSSRKHKYCYLPLIAVQKRVLPTSTSAKQYIKNSKMLVSTLEVCNKAYRLNVNKQEDFALIKRLAYEGKMSFVSSNSLLGFSFFILAIKVFFKIR
ncbi:MAG: glycosyltransferase [Cyclobacteriaceae bacterium]|nr:glycosyltransferase [Cyclobacteriaceae bacterium]